VQNTSNVGITWTLSGMGCTGAACGTLSSTTTNPVTYNAPANPPPSNFTVTITATSAADTTKSGSVTITVPAVAVSITPAPATVLAGNTQSFTATVQNTSNVGVTWTLSGAGCTGVACGTLSSTTANSVTYAAPGPPASNLTVTITAASAVDSTKTASAMITVPAITVAVSPAGNVGVLIKSTQIFTATVGDDAGNKGVTWALDTLDRNDGTLGPCSVNCGTITPATLSGAPATYTSPAVCCGLNVVIVATSVSDTTKSALGYLSVLDVLVKVSPSGAGVIVSTTQDFTATVTNDPTNSGVSWTLLDSSPFVACSPACGTVVPNITASGVPTTYTAPATVPANPLVIVSATSVAAPEGGAGAVVVSSQITIVPACGTGSEALLNGQYAFLLRGSEDGWPVPPIAIAGSFTADGKGNITAGQEDVNRNDAGGATNLTITPAGSSYSVGADHRGCLTLVTPTTTSSYRFSLGAFAGTPSVAGHGHIISFDLTGGTKVAGFFEKQDPPAFSPATFSGDFAFGALGPFFPETVSGRFAIAGRLTADGVGAITAAEADLNNNGTPMHIASFAGPNTFAVAANGRGTLTLNPGAGLASVHASFYIVSANEAVLLSTDPGPPYSLFSGSVLRQSGGPFAGGSLSAPAILAVEAQQDCGASPHVPEPCPLDQVGILTPDGANAFTFTYDENNGGLITTPATNTLSGTYSVAPDGRVTITAGPNSPVIYLVSPNKGFLVGTDPGVSAGSFEPQLGTNFDNASFAGPYAFGGASPMWSGVLSTGVFTADGAMPTGHITGTSDDIGSLPPINDTYTVLANGRTTTGSGNILYIVSPSKAVVMNVAIGTITR
jgi:hypothetical protein